MYEYRAIHKHVCASSEKFDSNTTTNSFAESPGCIGIMFLIIDKFPHEDIWKLWLANKTTSNENIRILIHAKYPENIESPWVLQHLVTSFHYVPEWGSSDITRVMLGLMKEMLISYPCIQKAIFASESCIPIVPLDTFLHLTTCDNDSWMNFQNEAGNGFVQQKQVCSSV